MQVCKVSETVCESLAKARAEMRTMSNQVGPSGTLSERDIERVRFTGLQNLKI